MAVVSMKTLLESGVHFGHRTHKWNPNMKPYIFTERNGIHIINLQLTVKAIEEAHETVKQIVAGGGTVLFVGTKRQAQETIQQEADRCGMPYVTARWLGGFLTNWRTIRDRINELERLEREQERGNFERLKKKERLQLQREIDKLDMRLGGIRSMTRLPDLMFVVDVRREETAIHEANLLNIPTLALVDTNCDPTNIDYVIPSNDDAIRAIKLLVSMVADAVLEGKDLRKEDPDYVEEEMKRQPEPKAPARPRSTLDHLLFDEDEDELSDEDLLGAATLAKLQIKEEELPLDEPAAPVVPEPAQAAAAESETPAPEAALSETPAEEQE
jgi:small subunit ribosomal protein S2